MLPLGSLSLVDETNKLQSFGALNEGKPNHISLFFITFSSPLNPHQTNVCWQLYCQGTFNSSHSFTLVCDIALIALALL